MAQKYIDVKFINESSKGIPDEVIEISQQEDFTYNDINDELDEWNLKVKSVEIECLTNGNKVTITIGDK